MGRLDSMKGGGFLNNVDGTLVGYEFTHTFPGGATNEDDLYGVLTVRPDGATDPVQTTVRFGSSQYLEIVDPQTVRNPEGGQARIWDKSDGYRFLQSIQEVGGFDPIDDTDPSELSFKGLIGRRFQFVQEKDVARMEARVKAGKSAKRKDEATGREYDFTRLTVGKVYDGVAPVQPAAKAPATAGRTKVVGRGKTAAAAAPATAGVDDGEVTTILRKILRDNGGAVLRSDITRLATTELLTTKNPRREAIRKRMYDAAFLVNAEGVVYDVEGQTVEIAG